MTDRTTYDGASSAPINLIPTRSSGVMSRKERQEPRIIRYFKETAGPARPDPWVGRKYAVGLLLAIAGWCAYVIFGRICIPVFQGTSTSRFSVGSAGGILAGYIAIMLLMGWSYIRIITTGPGHAKDHVPQTSQPVYTQVPGPQAPLQQTGGVIPVALQRHETTVAADADRIQHQPTASEDVAPEPGELAPFSDALRSVLPHSSSEERSSSGTLTSNTDTSPRPALAGAKRVIPDWQTVERPLPDILYGRRWCRFCRIDKPDRTHHCRHCGTCVMQFDHHCPWIGQCVGWANHKFFMTFNFWAIIYWYYHLILLVIYLTQADIDGQVIGVITLSALFGIFTSMMLFQHAYLIVTGKSTVEAFSGRDQQERETQHLNILFGFWSHQKEKRLVRKKWKEEFGGTTVDDRWRMGTKMDMWRREMGPKWYGWIFPIGRPLGDGLHFPSNPRFGPSGEWLKKTDWPKGIEE